MNRERRPTFMTINTKDQGESEICMSYRMSNKAAKKKIDIEM